MSTDINSNQDSFNNEDKNPKLWNGWVIFLIVISVIIIFLSFFAPLIFTQTSSYFKIFDDSTGVIGDTIGGIMNPFIALAGVIVTGLAFYMQLRANQIQIQNFKKEFDKQKVDFDTQLKIQEEQNKINQFESQFYEMLRLHKENVNELEIEIYDFIISKGRNGGGSSYEKNRVSRIIKGREVFIYLSNELEISFQVFLNFLEFYDEDFSFKIPYDVFFKGTEALKDTLSHNFYSNFTIAKSEFKEIYLDGAIEFELNDYFNDVYVKAKYSIFEGQENRLGHYFRHLFHTVKFVAEQDESFITYKEKRKYLRLLRAQLSNYEQALLFYNYLAYAPEWEVENKFFTDFRMIHNLFPEILINHRYFNEEFNKIENTEGFKTYKEFDPIFECQK